MQFLLPQDKQLEHDFNAIIAGEPQWNTWSHSSLRWKMAQLKYVKNSPRQTKPKINDI